jgi:hypothetical protein
MMNGFLFAWWSSYATSAIAFVSWCNAALLPVRGAMQRYFLHVVQCSVTSCTWCNAALLSVRGAMQRYFLYVVLLLLSLQDPLWLAVLLSPAVQVCCVLHGLPSVPILLGSGTLWELIWEIFVWHNFTTVAQTTCFGLFTLLRWHRLHVSDYLLYYGGTDYMFRTIHFTTVAQTTCFGQFTLLRWHRLHVSDYSLYYGGTDYMFRTIR